MWLLPVIQMSDSDWRFEMHSCGHCQGRSRSARSPRSTWRCALAGCGGIDQQRARSRGQNSPSIDAGTCSRCNDSCLVVGAGPCSRPGLRSMDCRRRPFPNSASSIFSIRHRPADSTTTRHSNLTVTFGPNGLTRPGAPHHTTSPRGLRSLSKQQHCNRTTWPVQRIRLVRCPRHMPNR